MQYKKNIVKCVFHPLFIVKFPASDSMQYASLPTPNRIFPLISRFPVPLKIRMQRIYLPNIRLKRMSCKIQYPVFLHEFYVSVIVKE